MSYAWIPANRPAPRPPWLVRHARWIVLLLAVALCAAYLIGWSAWAGSRAGKPPWTGPSGPTAISDEGVTLTVLQIKRTKAVLDPVTGLESTAPEGSMFLDVEMEASSPVELAQALSCRPTIADVDRREWEAKYEAVTDDSGQDLPRDCAGVEPVGPQPVRYWVRYEVPLRYADRIVGLVIPLGDRQMQVIAP
ncbi:MAG: hypothetical protein L0G99_16080 [Propionibacteriales bacterium]|nr:hypothetical protein [Propionibacteriales bacterium]